MKTATIDGFTVEARIQHRDECPGCSGKKYRRVLGVSSGRIHRCERCGAIVADSIYLGESYEAVLPWFSEAKGEVEARYFDFVCIGSEGISRRHGWFNIADRRIVQIG